MLTLSTKANLLYKLLVKRGKYGLSDLDTNSFKLHIIEVCFIYILFFSRDSAFESSYVWTQPMRDDVTM